MDKTSGMRKTQWPIGQFRNIAKNSRSKPPNERAFHVNVTAVKLRIYSKANPDCSGATIRELEQSRSAARPFAEDLEAALFKTAAGGYTLRLRAK